LRRVRRPDFLTIENSFSPSLPRPSILPGVSTYRTVQNCEATSVRAGVWADCVAFCVEIRSTSFIGS